MTLDDRTPDYYYKGPVGALITWENLQSSTSFTLGLFPSGNELTYIHTMVMAILCHVLTRWPVFSQGITSLHTALHRGLKLPEFPSPDGVENEPWTRLLPLLPSVEDIEIGKSSVKGFIDALTTRPPRVSLPHLRGIVIQGADVTAHQFASLTSALKTFHCDAEYASLDEAMPCPTLRLESCRLGGWEIPDFNVDQNGD